MELTFYQKHSFYTEAVYIVGKSLDSEVIPGFKFYLEHISDL